MRNSRGVRRILLIVVAMALSLPQAMGANPAVGQQELDYEQIAIDYIRDNAADWGLTAADVAEIRVSASYTSTHNRVTQSTFASIAAESTLPTRTRRSTSVARARFSSSECDSFRYHLPRVPKV